MIKAGILGATGLAGETLTRILACHPGVELTYLGSEHAVGQNIDEVCPGLGGIISQPCEPIDVKKAAKAADIIFLTKGHREALELAPPLLQNGKKVIDVGADFRFKDYKVYEQYYKVKHTHPELLKIAVYGQPELHHQEIRETQLIANPGCYATSIILGLAPLVAQDLVELDSLIADAISGISGSGRTYRPTTDNLFLSCYGNLKAYQVGSHAHQPETEQELSLLANRPIKLTFVPHIAPLDRGIQTTMFAKLKAPTKTTDLLKVYQEFYQAEPFIKIFNNINDVTIDKVVHTNFCALGVWADGKTAIIISTIDNLGKGAASQMVQNMNIMCGFDETTGLMLGNI